MAKQQRGRRQTNKIVCIKNNYKIINLLDQFSQKDIQWLFLRIIIQGSSAGPDETSHYFQTESSKLRALSSKRSGGRKLSSLQI
jgi:hypothetical protein